MIGTMSPALIIVLLLAGLLALVPVWRLQTARWPRQWLFASWVVYALMILAAMRFGAASRFLIPVLVVLYLAPFVAGPERLARLVRSRPEPPRPIIDVTPAPPAGLPGPEPGAPAGEPAIRARPRRRAGRGLHADPPGMDEDDA